MEMGFLLKKKWLWISHLLSVFITVRSKGKDWLHLPDLVSLGWSLPGRNFVNFMAQSLLCWAPMVIWCQLWVSHCSFWTHFLFFSVFFSSLRSIYQVFFFLLPSFFQNGHVIIIADPASLFSYSLSRESLSHPLSLINCFHPSWPNSDPVLYGTLSWNWGLS